MLSCISCYLLIQGFREGRFQVLVATDVAARGLDIPEVDLVIQCEPPKVILVMLSKVCVSGTYIVRIYTI